MVKDDYIRMLSNYQLFNNIINQDDLERECNPLGVEVGQIRDVVQPYNKTYNKILSLLGEELKRPFNYRTILIDSEGIRSKLEKKDYLYRNYILQQLQDTINSVQHMYPADFLEGIMDSIIPPQDVDNYIKFTYRDRREDLASKTLNFLSQALDIKALKNDAFKHGLLSGMEIIYVGASFDEPTIRVVNPLGFFYHKSNDTKWIQDSLAAGYRTYMTSGEVLDRYAKYLTKEEINKIESGELTSPTGTDFKLKPDMQYGRKEEDLVISNVLNTNMHSDHGAPKMTNILVQHVE